MKYTEVTFDGNFVFTMYTLQQQECLWFITFQYRRQGSSFFTEGAAYQNENEYRIKNQKIMYTLCDGPQNDAYTSYTHIPHPHIFAKWLIFFRGPAQACLKKTFTMPSFDQQWWTFIQKPSLFDKTNKICLFFCWFLQKWKIFVYF